MKAAETQAKRTEFQRLLEPNLPSLYGLALRLTRNEADAQDLVQQAVLKAYRFFHTFQPGTNFRAWIFKVLTNEFNSQYHRDVRERNVAEVLDEPNHYERFVGQASTSRTPEERVTDILLQQDIARALEELSPEFRQAVVLCDVEGFSYREIADIMGCPIGTVMSRLYRGRRALQKKLYKYAVERGLIADEQGDREVSDDGKVASLDDYRNRKRR